MYLKSIRGIEGEIRLKSIGATIGTTAKWSLTRKEDSSQLFTFNAVLSYLNPLLFNEPGLEKEFKIKLGKGGKEYRIEQSSTGTVQLLDMQLLMEDVTLWPIEP